MRQNEARDESEDGMQIGPYELAEPVMLAPMAGITDKPFRRLCRGFGAALAPSEMITSDLSLQHTRKTVLRADHSGDVGPISVQIAGSDPAEMAAAAVANVAKGAQIIDINMGCPAKKVCNVLAGSALMKDEALVSRILQAVVEAVAVPVTLKTRLGWDDEHLNLPTIAQLAEEAGIAALAVHGRTRTQMYQGEAHYELIAAVKAQSRIPVTVNGDITSPQKAVQVLQATAADAVMIGRGAQGAPWLFRDIVGYLRTGELPEALSVATISDVILGHLAEIYDFYGEYMGCRIARKHIGWYIAALPDAKAFRQQVNKVESSSEQWAMMATYLTQQQAALAAWPSAYRTGTE